MTSSPYRAGHRSAASITGIVLLAIAGAAVLAVMIWQGIATGGSPDPSLGSNALSASLDIGVLVFREGLECILVLAAITASMVGDDASHRKPVAGGAAVAAVATFITWLIAVQIVDHLANNFSALAVQAGTGLLAIVVLLVVMNWFFHKVYWTGWISLHTGRKRRLMQETSDDTNSNTRRLTLGLAMLGFTSLYREGFEVVLFLQTYRLQLGNTPVLRGVLLGISLSAIVAVITFVAQRKLPYKRMLIATGVMLGAVLLVMVGEQAQEMQLAGWIHTTPIPALQGVIPAWMGLWFSVFPTVETMVAQGIAALLVIGSYFVSQSMSRK